MYSIQFIYHENEIEKIESHKFSTNITIGQLWSAISVNLFGCDLTRCNYMTFNTNGKTYVFGINLSLDTILENSPINDGTIIYIKSTTDDMSSHNLRHFQNWLTENAVHDIYGNMICIYSPNKEIIQPTQLSDISELELYKYNKKQNKSDICVICYGIYLANDELCRLPCGHYYHVSCLQQWFTLSKKTQCPLCRKQY